MTYRTPLRLCALALFAVIGLIAQNAAQSKTPWKVPRMADGHPDLQGVWSNATRTPLERPAEFAGKATVTDAKAKEWEQKEHQAWQELDGTSEGTGAYNVLFL